ncbi:MAG TPA: response regulator [Gammaproteobacteria bacterium]|nr:response regulator [Gammaproteobacteria bacterium]
MMRVLLAAGLQFGGLCAKEIVEAQPGMVVAEAEEGAEVLRRARARDFDVAVLDLDFPGAGALEVIRRLVRLNRPRVLLVTVHARLSYPDSLFGLGLHGHLTRQCEAPQLIEALKTVHGGQRYVAPDIARQVSHSLMDRRRRSPLDGFTFRQLQVALMIGQGHRPAEISERLHLHVKTVNTHRRHARHQLGITSDAELQALLMAHGLLETPDHMS